MTDDWIKKLSISTFESNRLGNVACLYPEQLETLCRAVRTRAESETAFRCAHAVRTLARSHAVTNADTHSSSDADSESSAIKGLYDLAEQFMRWATEADVEIPEPPSADEPSSEF